MSHQQFYETVQREQEYLEMSNMKLWGSVFTTDPKQVKEITGKQYKGHSPNPYWLIQRATEVFGPIGIGWGVTVKSERFERLSEHDVLHVAVVSVWYVLDGKRSETFDQMGGTKAAYLAGSGKLIVDEDAGKKSVTDATVKCLSMIGFAGDIFSGRWDDSGYVQEAAAITAERESPRITESQTEELKSALEGRDIPTFFSWVSKKTGRDCKTFSDILQSEFAHVLAAARKAGAK